MAELVGQKHWTDLDSADPILLVRSIFEKSTADALAQLSKVVTDAAEQIATTTVLSENNARARGEKIVTEAARWGSEQIRMAGIDAAKIVAAQLDDAIARSQRAARTATIAAWISSASAAACVAITIVLWLH